MGHVHQIVDDIVASAKSRESKHFAEATASLSAENRSLVAANLGFAVMHMLLCVVAESLTTHGYVVDISRSGGEVAIALNNRIVTCSHFVGERHVRLRLLGGPLAADWEQTWTPPVSTDLSAVHAAAKHYAERIAKHLVG